ncbi:AraC family transcriptional regulator [Sphingomonas sp. BK580]|uniref:helix-turn-helix transcriptional regulator n=1 Tax=Sphingomonas sp. BK580 TaxID=2586972 RepID=UPI001622D202|nr:AraC family transcriptional regulator [Sphingomonas sp. BK580]
MWRDVVGRALTGCEPAPLVGEQLAVDFSLVQGDATRVGVTRLSNIRNHRDRACLRDQDDDLIFFLQLRGEGLLEHCGQRCRLRRGEGMLARFDRTLDTRWVDADLLLIRLSRESLRGVDPGAAIGVKQPASSSVMKLLLAYARTAWRDAGVTGALAPIADRHIAELVAALCLADAEDGARRARPVLAATRLAAMREVMRREFANPCLAMRDVAASVGLSERTGHLVFAAEAKSFLQELHDIRLRHACERLRSGNSRVIDIAYAVGFSDASHFHRLFKQRYSHSPAEWRTQRLIGSSVTSDA